MADERATNGQIVSWVIDDLEMIVRHLRALESGALEVDEAGAAQEAIDIHRGVVATKKKSDKLFDDIKGRCREIIERSMAETGQMRFETAVGGLAYISAPYTRISYNRKALDALAASDAELATKIMPHRTEKSVDGSLRVK